MKDSIDLGASFLFPSLWILNLARLAVSSVSWPAPAYVFRLSLPVYVLELSGAVVNLVPLSLVTPGVLGRFGSFFCLLFCLFSPTSMYSRRSMIFRVWWSSLHGAIVVEDRRVTHLM